MQLSNDWPNVQIYIKTTQIFDGVLIPHYVYCKWNEKSAKMQGLLWGIV